MHLRQIIGPQREVLARFARGEFKLIRAHLVPYYRDVYDGLFHISELAQSYTDSLTGILQVYLNMSSNQTGEVVKLLTMITVITTPLMMVGTWYGMNFKTHAGAELAARLLAGRSVITVVSTAATYWYFKKREMVLDAIAMATRQIQFSRQGPRPHRAARRGRSADGRPAAGARTELSRDAVQHHRGRRAGGG